MLNRYQFRSNSKANAPYSKAKGFTLIELIIVIVILGILAVTAAPQFFNFGSDARESTVRGLQGSINSTAELVNARAAINGVESQEAGQIDVNGTNIVTRFGYPDFIATGILAGNEADAEAAVIAILNINAGDWDYSYQTGTPFAVRLAPNGLNEVTAATLNSISRCYVQYTPPEAEGAGPSVIVDTDNC